MPFAQKVLAFSLLLYREKKGSFEKTAGGLGEAPISIMKRLRL